MRMTQIAAAALIPLACIGSAISGPPTYKCVSEGKTRYSDEPCPGASIVDTTPTQGMDKMSGQKRTGADVQRVETRKVFDQALKPLTGKSNAEMEVLRRRINLTEADKRECTALDPKMAGKNATKEDQLLKDRQRYRDLRC